MRILVNGEWRDESDGISLVDLLDSLSLEPHRVAVERNKSIVPRKLYPTAPSLRQGVIGVKE